VFVAGATGAIGRPLVRQLREAGHEVTGMTRSPAKADQLRAAGAEAVVCDAFDFDRLSGAVEQARPEVVIHQLTELPSTYDVRHYGRMVAPTNKLRSEVTPVLIGAAREAGARRVISQSIAFIYAPVGGPVKEEGDALIDEGQSAVVDAVRATAGMESMVTGAQGVDGLVLRYGQFYGPGTYFAADGSIAKEVRRRRFPIVGDGGGVFSFVHVEDAASATVAALDHGRAEIYNVCDDEPAAVSEWLPVYAQTLGAKPPRRVPVWLARLLGGSIAATSATELRGASNAKAKRDLQWSPRYASWRQGFAEALG
jgi:nucleoside-diphosphate-sugar epimerase